jgi:site-specific recombinase XerD
LKRETVTRRTSSRSPDQLPLPLDPGFTPVQTPAETPAESVSTAAALEPLPPLDPATARLFDLIPRFLTFAAAIDRSDYTLDAFRLDLSLLTRFLGNRVAREIGLDDLRNFAAWLRLERKNDPRSLRRKVASVKAFFTYLVQAEIREDNPARQLIYPSSEPHVPEFLEADESERLLAAAERPLWRALLLMLLDLGLKRDEVLALHPADVHFEASGNPGYLVIRAADQARKVRSRLLPLSERLASELRPRVENTSEERLFPLSVRAINFIVETCGKRAGLRKRGTISPQMLRDTFAVREVRRRVAEEAKRRSDGASTTELASLRQRHDQEVLDLLGLSPSDTTDPIARYRIVGGVGISVAPLP